MLCGGRRAFTKRVPLRFGKHELFTLLPTFVDIDKQQEDTARHAPGNMSTIRRSSEEPQEYAQGKEKGERHRVVVP